MARHALLIGVSEFADDRLARLNAPTNDVLALRGIMQDNSRGAFDSVELSLNDDFVTMRDHLSRFFNDRAPDDLLLLYYSGHGILGRGNRLFLATTGSNLDTPRDRSISAKEIRDFIEECRAERQIIILDCCHSGAFAEHAKAAAPPPAVTGDTFSGADAGLYVLTAADALQFAWDGNDLRSGNGYDGGGFSQFTSWLVEGLEKGATAPDDEQITIDALYRYLFRRARAAGAPATPQRFVQGGVGDLVVARNPLAGAGQIDPATSAALESEDWRVRLGAVTELAQLVGENAGGARAARLLLQRQLPQERDFAVRTAITAALQNAPSPETKPVDKSDLQPASPPPKVPATSLIAGVPPAAAAAKSSRAFKKVAIAAGLTFVGLASIFSFYRSAPAPTVTTAVTSAVNAPTNAATDSNFKVFGHPVPDQAPNNAKAPPLGTNNPPKMAKDPSALLGGNAIDLLPGEAASNRYNDPALNRAINNQKDLEAKLSKLEQETKAVAPPSNNSGTYAGTYTASLAPGINRITTQFQQSGSGLASTYQTSTGVSGIGIGTISGNVGTMNWQNTSPNCPGEFRGTYVFDADKMTFSANGQDCLGVEVIKGEATRVN